jgi:hypothetical protein
MSFQEPPVALPSLVSSSSSFTDLLTNTTDDDDGWMGGPSDRSGRFLKPEVKVANDDADDYLDEAPSMTLRDILLRADMTQFDLLGKYIFSRPFVMVLNTSLLLTDAEEHEDLGDGSFGWD